MRIAVEVPYYALGARGSTQYGENLVRALGAASPQDRFYAFNYFYGDHARRRDDLAARLAADNVELALPRWPQSWVDRLERAGYPFVERRFLRPRGIDVFHNAGAHPIKTPNVITVHGVPWYDPPGRLRFEQAILPRLAQASAVIAVSRCIRDYLLRFYPIAESRCALIHYGVDHQVFRPISDAKSLDQARRRHGLPERFLLCVGPFQLRDNIEALLYVLRRRRDHRLLRGLKLALLGGSLEEHGHALKRRVAQLGLEDMVVWVGYVPHDQLAAVYNLAQLYVHPSFYEELGAQLLEASACGRPILAARGGGIE
ncbi:MAG: glycosyltransferase, partial [Elusimicrobia bacterium]|nr:glycosyltransferase [Elusimicrobiota bacterium]